MCGLLLNEGLALDAFHGGDFEAAESVYRHACALGCEGMHDEYTRQIVGK